MFDCVIKELPCTEIKTSFCQFDEIFFTCSTVIFLAGSAVIDENCFSVTTFSFQWMYTCQCFALCFAVLRVKTSVMMQNQLQSKVVIFRCDQTALWMVLSICLSVCQSVCPSHLFHYVRIIVSSWNNFQKLLPMTEMMPMQKVKVKGQRLRSQKSKPNLAISGL